MNHLGNLHYAEGSRRKRKRIGRGQGSGRGGTSTRGHKGAQSRAGAKRKVGFEGGQMPLHRRLPKFGFTNLNRVEYEPVNLARLARLVAEGRVPDGRVDPDALRKLGVVSGRRFRVKILGVGELAGPLAIAAHACSASARAKIEAAGGSITLLTA
jgi:large subunit ribosomal protein L15